MAPSDNDKEFLERHRREHFAVKLDRDTFHRRDSSIDLSMTHNGTSWQSINLTPEEAWQVIQALKPFARNPKKGKV